MEPLLVDVLASDDNPALKIEREENILLLRHALEGLKLEDRVAVLSRFAYGLSYKQMSEALQIPLGTAGCRIHRSIKTLRARFRKAG